MTIFYKDNEAQEIISSAQTLTNSWEDLGEEIDCRDCHSIGVFLTIDINSSTNVRIKALGKHTKAGTEEYNMPIKTVSSSDVKIEDEYLEFNDDSDQLVVIEIVTNESRRRIKVSDL